MAGGENAWQAVILKEPEVAVTILLDDIIDGPSDTRRRCQALACNKTSGKLA